jgi:hypothetical protein
LDENRETVEITPAVIKKDKRKEKALAENAKKEAEIDLKVLEGVGHEQPVQGLAWMDNLLYSVSLDDTMRVWDPNNMQCINSISAHKDGVTHIFSTRGKLFTAGRDMVVRTWISEVLFHKMISFFLSLFICFLFFSFSRVCAACEMPCCDAGTVRNGPSFTGTPCVPHLPHWRWRQALLGVLEQPFDRSLANYRRLHEGQRTARVPWTRRRGVGIGSTRKPPLQRF